MYLNPVMKAIIIAVTVALTAVSSTSAYFDFGDVEIKDFEETTGEQGGNVIILPTEEDHPLFNDDKLGVFDFSGIIGSAQPEPEPEPEPVPGDTDEDGIQDDFDLDGKTDVIPGAVKEVVNTSEMPVWDKSGEYMEINKLMLVNRSNPVTADYVPVDLVRPDYYATNRSESGQYMTREACDAFNKLAGDAEALGYEIVVTTAYRSYNFQSYLYNMYVERDGQEAADRKSAKPGTSEHQSGLTADVSSPSVGYELVQDYGDTAEGIWLAENCYKYGFILRFPEGKEGITGYMYEPWHIRYVGQDVARTIYALDITFEEYCEQYLNL
ncbi:MAG: D-alanyl-D-alanine carboxypeptidase family protein [Clostridiales bacterium]|nr:D-alanyl-D-alanine carboxypeptidase family protein [Clostridiales bacterium]